MEEEDKFKLECGHNAHKFCAAQEDASSHLLILHNCSLCEKAITANDRESAKLRLTQD